MLTSAAVLEARFTVTRFREGYDQDEVTAFLQRAQAALAAWERGTGAPGLTGDDVVNQRFTPTKFDNGFDQDEVDVFLDRSSTPNRPRSPSRLRSPNPNPNPR
jgi:DivIVA domain-containing protein